MLFDSTEVMQASFGEIISTVEDMVDTVSDVEMDEGEDDAPFNVILSCTSP